MGRRTFIGIGSNLGDAAARCEEAMQRIAALHDAAASRFSSLYVTSPVSEVLQNDFTNAAIALDWDQSPLQLLRILKEIERTMGRVRAARNGPRSIDLDILLCGDCLLESPELTIPHPRMHLRRFTLVPCLEIDPGLVHPLYGVALAQYLAAIPDTQHASLLKPVGLPVPTPEKLNIPGLL
jgi:2-amino-4-hydroxy-6-hydroxymethyldihydropteridine diphosphokinase